MGDRPFGGVAWCDGRCADRSQVAVALVPSPTGLRRSDLRLRRANRSGLGCFSPWALGRRPRSSSTWL